MNLNKLMNPAPPVLVNGIPIPPPNATSEERAASYNAVAAGGGNDDNVISGEISPQARQSIRDHIHATVEPKYFNYTQRLSFETEMLPYLLPED
ncbi:hypothetical protein AC578_3649 [Pseudocercospora eumusae]|uniref:Uncharacterized protein n=1 Tax=Pseudocercospora eumusae TaxID=321146 RepID=A0A139GV30_9PEZI|nr:hypothetical protein AC578_3649 [Pseudocercospora eumusae]